MAIDETKLKRFRSGQGFGWHEQDAALFHGTERFFRPGYSANLVGNWLSALDGVEAKLRAGARVAAARSRDTGRIHTFPSRDRDPVQFELRSAVLSGVRKARSV